MCTGVEIVMLGGALLGAGAAVHQGQTQKNYNNYLAAQAEADARAEQSAARVEAERIRKAGKQQKSEAIAALAASGVDVTSGTALKIDQEIGRASSEDAFLTLAGGRDRAARLNADAQGSRMAGSRAQTAGYLNATNTLLVAGTNSGKGWKKAGGR
ncbi:hypothetical protein [Stenotrophomonas acidaminiphila]|uniref:hypothetical protein n=1 Tax=Stenotrophomonas acidaminiphila TaxID=128780 RepID=UPI0028A66809|nr:hypothetical protein [Stenotrophomonas acidaminiphila]